MAVVNVQVNSVKRKGNNIHVTVIDENNRVIERTLNKNDINNWDDFATWLVNQQPDYELLPDKEKALEITFHNEVIDGQTVRVVDSVVVT